MKALQFSLGALFALTFIAAFAFIWHKPNTIPRNYVTIQKNSEILQITEIPTPIPTPKINIKVPPVSYTIPSKGFVGQTFNNCGPATLSMGMRYWEINIDQITLGNKMRPYQHPRGDNDDKSIFADEFVIYAREYGLHALARPNGSIEILKKFTANDIPVIVRTWLHPNEDIGHFRIVRGYDDNTQVLIQDDSYEGPDRQFNYDVFASMWQPFNYGYILVYPQEKESLVKEILGEEFDERKAWENSIVQAQAELSENPTAVYPQFNLSSAYYNLGDYQKSVESFEKVEERLPFRMMWYQIEPILAYQKLGNNDRVFSLTDKILNNNNRAFSELYQIRGELYLSQGNKDAAREEFEKAVTYNINFKQAQKSLSQL